MDDDAQRALVNAQGVALATLAVLLHRKQVIELDAFARIVALQSTMTTQTSEAEGEILGVWAAYLQDAADTAASLGFGATTSDEPEPSH